MTRDTTWPPEPLYVAVDIAACRVHEDHLEVLLLRRPYEPFEGAWALPGSFSHPDETLDETARRALESKTPLAGAWLEQLATYDQPGRGGAPGRDPRGRVVAVAYLALTGPDRGEIEGAGRDAASDDVRWFAVDDLPEPLAFDHARMLDDAVERLRAKTRYAPLAFRLLPAEFTLPELQAVYEAVLGESLDVRNFRRDLRDAGVIEETGRTRQEGPGRPAKLYRHVPGTFAVDADERKVAERIQRGG